MTTEPITITLVYNVTGQSEPLPVQGDTTKINDLMEWAKALFDIDGTIQFMKDGKIISTNKNDNTLQQVGIQDGDLLVVVVTKNNNNQTIAAAGNNAAVTSSSTGTGGLDFSNLLSSSQSSAASTGGGGTNSNNASATGLDFSNLLGSTSTSTISNNNIKYYPGMNLEEAQMYNPHPEAICTLIYDKEHLQKELNYYNPILAKKLLQPKLSISQAAQVWREHVVKGSIASAMRVSNTMNEEKIMKERLEKNPNDVEAKAYFDKKDNEKLINEQYIQVMEEYPESFGRVLMLYIEAKINGHIIQAFCDSGAQSTIMSKKLAIECGIYHLIDTRMAGIAVGVGTGKILGRIHMVQLQINNNYYFPCSVTVMDDPTPNVATGTSGTEMPFLLGLDMMKRHLCQIDLEKGCLKFRIAPGQYFETPFLHEKDLNESQGGTKGFNAEKANLEFIQRMAKEDDDNDETDTKKKSSEGDGMDIDEDKK